MARSQRMRKLHKPSGFTLVEVVVSLLIFALVMLYLLPFFSYGHRHTVNSDETTYGLQRAKDVLETCQTMPYDDISVGTDLFVSSSTVNDVTFTATRTSSETVTAEQYYKTINVTVSWQHPSQPARSVTLRTLVAAPGE